MQLASLKVVIRKIKGKQITAHVIQPKPGGGEQEGQNLLRGKKAGDAKVARTLVEASMGKYLKPGVEIEWVEERTDWEQQ